MKSSSENGIEYLHAVLQSSPVGMLVFDENRKIVFSNSEAEELFNQAECQSPGLRCGDFIHCLLRHKDRKGCGYSEKCANCPLDRALRKVLNSREKDQSIKGEAEIHNDNSYIPKFISYKANSLDVLGERYAVMAMEDITEQKTAEYALRKSEERYRALFEKSSQGVILHNSEGKILEANQAASDIFGYSLEELKTMHPRDLVHTDEKESVFNDAERIESEDSIHREHRCIRKGGKELFVTLRIKMAAKDLIQVILQDVTLERKQKQELRLLTRAIEQSAETVVITDRRGIIEYVNPAFTNITGYSSEEAIGKNPRILKSGKMEKSHHKNLWDTISSGGTWRGEFCNRKKMGEEYWEMAVISPVFIDGGEISHYVAVKRDITWQKELEQHKEDVDRIMRHDLKTPLNGIINLPKIITADENITEE